MPAIAMILAAMTTQALSECRNRLGCSEGAGQNNLKKICVTVLAMVASEWRYIA